MFEFVITALNLLAVTGLFIISLIILNTKIEIQKRHAVLNQHLDELQVLIQKLTELEAEERKAFDQKDTHSRKTNSKRTS